MNRLTKKQYPDSTAVTYTLDAADRLTQVVDPTGTYSFTYDNMDRLTQASSTYSVLASKTFSVSYSYDAASKRTSFTDPNSSSTSYSYDTLNRLTQIKDFNRNTFGFSYDALSRATQMTRPNSVTTNYQYDSVSNLLSVLHQNGTTTLDGAAYTYDAAGNRQSKTNKLNGAASNFAYDNLYQLTGVTQGANTVEAYTYDAAGNRLSSSTVANYSYDVSNELQSAGTATYTYDANGNTLTKTDSTGTTNYAWDFENRLTSVTPPGATSATFKYDPMGRRIQKGSSFYVYDAGNLIQESDTSGNLIARYIQGLGIDQPLAAYRGKNSEFYEADGLGSVTSLSTTAGAVNQTYVFDSFGNTSSTTGTFTQPFRFTGREYDSETGLLYYRARYYDPSTGRFLSEDPIRFGAGSDLYSYVRNNPANVVDPSGRNPIVGAIPWWIWVAGGTGAGAAGGVLVGAGEIAIPVGMAGTIGWGIGRGVAHIPIYGGGTVEDGWTQIFTLLFFSQSQSQPKKKSKQPKCEKDDGVCKKLYEAEKAACAELIIKIAWSGGQPRVADLIACHERAALNYSRCLQGLPPIGTSPVPGTQPGTWH